MAPISRAHSVALDPHKWLCVPIECGAVLVREAAIQHATFSLHAPYLRGEETPEIHGNPWPFEFGVQLSRSPRAIKTAAVLMRLGRSGVAETVSRHRALAREFADWIEAAEDLELTAPVPLSLVCFRYVPPGQPLSDDVLDQLNQQIADAVNARGRAFFTPTTIHGRLSLRVSIIHYDVTSADLEVLLDEIRTVAANLVPASSESVSA